MLKCSPGRGFECGYGKMSGPAQTFAGNLITIVVIDIKLALSISVNEKINYALQMIWHNFVSKLLPKPTSHNMDRRLYMLSVLSSIQVAHYSPVQIQKIFFLLDKNISDRIGGPYFNFEAYHYGPFDKNVYKELDKLTASKDITLAHEQYSNVRLYALTPIGFQKGVNTLNNFREQERSYIREICAFVKSLSFEQLLKSIYKEYPEMKVNSIFQP